MIRWKASQNECFGEELDPRNDRLGRSDAMNITQSLKTVLALGRVLTLTLVVLYRGAHPVEARALAMGAAPPTTDVISKRIESLEMGSNGRSTWLSLPIIRTVAPLDGTVSPGGADSAFGPRVRSSHRYLRAMIDEAVLRSRTFRSIVAAIEGTNGIVYVEHGACMHGVRTCLALGVTTAADYRILRVFVDARQPDWDVMASIGHELRHALEVLENPALVDNASVYLFYAQDQGAKDRPFETRAAIDAGFAVRHEVSSFAKGRLN
jgi:uncharacterized membrane protein